METKGLKHNFFMYFFRTFFNFGFSIIIFPFVIRKLGAENLGKLQYVEAIVAYFILFINLGIDTYGKREVALHRDNKEELSKIILELLVILFLTTFLGIIFYILFIYFYIDEIVIKKILYIYFFNIFLNFFNLGWVYVGLENQSYITKRDALFKLISALLILMFIKSNSDIYIYTGIIVLSLVGPNLFNIFNIRKIIIIKKIKLKNIKKHIKPLLTLFFSVLALSISYNLDSIMIKNIIGDRELGYYSFAMKFGKIPLIFSTSIVAIFYPKLCNLLGKNRKEEYYKLTTIGIEGILIFSFPASIGMFILSDIIVRIFAGIDFIPSIPIMKVFSVFILIMGIALCTGSMTLIANKRDKVYSLSVTIGSILNFLFNIIFISKMGALGAAIATIITEAIAIIVRIIFCRDIFININIININLLKIIVASIFMGIIVSFSKFLLSNIIINLLLSIGIGGITYFIFLLILKEKNSMLLINKLKKYIVTKN